MKERNLLELKPLRLCGWEMDGERAVVLAPKFTSRFMVKWLVPFLAKPFFRVRLDDFGTFVWNRCDGDTPVSRIAEEMQAHFGERADPVYDRINAFLHRLDREGLIRV